MFTRRPHSHTGRSTAPRLITTLVLRKNFWLDLVYWFCTPLLTRCITAAVLATVLWAFYGVGFDNLSATLLVDGFGVLSRHPTWLQCIEVLVLSDFVDYRDTPGTSSRTIVARPCHPSLARRDELDLLVESAPFERSDHPILSAATDSAGVFGGAIMSVVPFISFYVMFLHSNVRWDFGPLRLGVGQSCLPPLAPRGGCRRYRQELLCRRLSHLGCSVRNGSFPTDPPKGLRIKGPGLSRVPACSLKIPLSPAPIEQLWTGVRVVIGVSSSL